MRTPKHLHQARKISETFKDFVSPVVTMMGDEHDETGRDAILKFGSLVWNAVVLEDAIGKTGYVNRLRKEMARNTFRSRILNILIQRKRETFADDYRLVGNYRIYYRHGEWRLWAEARDPFSIGK